MSNEITTRNHIYDLKENTIIVQGKIFKRCRSGEWRKERNC